MTEHVTTWTNWSGTVRADVQVARPESVAELQRVVANSPGRVKAIGAGHSFTAIGATDGLQLRPDGLSGVVRADVESGLVTVLAGTRLHELNETLWHLGLALENLGDIDVQTVAGAISTGTHGTGAQLGGLATQVRGLQLVLRLREERAAGRGARPARRGRRAFPAGGPRRADRRADRRVAQRG